MIARTVLLLLFATTAHAQVPPQTVTWTQPGVDPSQAQSYAYTLTIREEGNPVLRTVSLLNTLCGGGVKSAECSTALPVEAQSAIVTGNISYLTALDVHTNQTSPLSTPFVGNQGCIFRDTLYAIGARAQANTNKQNMNRLLREFRFAKFKHLSTLDLKGNQFTVIEECVGYIIAGRDEDADAN